MAKKAGKKTQSNRSNKTRRNVRNRKNTKKQKRRTNKQNRKKRATRKRHGVKRGGAAEEPVGYMIPSGRLVLPAACLKGPITDKDTLSNEVAKFISNGESGMAALCFLHFTDIVEANSIYRPMATALNMAHNASSATAFRQMDVVNRNGILPEKTKPEQTFLEDLQNSNRRWTQIDEGKQLWQVEIDEYLQQFYDVHRVLYEASQSYSDLKKLTDIQTRLTQFVFSSSVKGSTKIAKDILNIICHLMIQEELESAVKDHPFTVALFNHIHGRILKIFDDIARIVNTIAEHNPTIVMTVIDYLLDPKFIPKVLANDEISIIEGIEKPPTFSLSRLWGGGPHRGPTVSQMIIPLKSLVLSKRALIQIPSFSELMKNKLWFISEMIPDQQTTILGWLDIKTENQNFHPLLSTISHFFINVIPNITDHATLMGTINLFVGIFRILESEFKKLIKTPMTTVRIIYTMPQNIKDIMKEVFERISKQNDEFLDTIEYKFEKYIQKIINKMLYVHYIINDNCSEMLRGNKNTIELVGDIKQITDKFNEEISREVQNTLAGLKKKARDRNKRGRERVSNMARGNAAKERAMAKVSKYYGKSRLGRSPSPEGRYFAEGYPPYKNATKHEVAVLERHQAEEKQHEGRAAAAEFIANAAEKMESSHNQGTSFAYSGP